MQFLNSALTATAARCRLPLPRLLPPPHRPLSSAPFAVSPLERVAVALGAAVVAFVDPARGDMVALLGELTGGPALRVMRDRMAADPEGARLLAARPRVRLDRPALAGLRALPPESFGAAYCRYLDAHGFSPDERHEVRFVQDAELRYVLQRYREAHDFWHVLAGLPPTVLGETAVKWLEAAQTGLPSAALSALVAPLRLLPEERAALRSVYVPWAVRTAREARYLMAVPYEELLQLPLDEVRLRLRLTPAPVRGESRAPRPVPRDLERDTGIGRYPAAA